MKNLFTRLVGMMIILFAFHNTLAQLPLNWEKSIFFPGTSSEIFSVTTTYDDGYVATGITYNSNDLFVIKLDKNGVEKWRYIKKLSNFNFVKGYEVIQTSTLGIIVVGSYKTSTTEYKGFMIKLSANGNEMFTKFLYGVGSSEIYSIAETQDGNLVFSGWTRKVDGTDGTWRRKTDMAGNNIWDHFNIFRQYGISILPITTMLNVNQYLLWDVADSKIASLYISESGSIYSNTDQQVLNVVPGGSLGKSINGFSQIGTTNLSHPTNAQDVFVRKYTGNTSGGYTLNFNKTYGGSAEEKAYIGGRQIVQTPDGGYAFVTSTKSNDADVSGNHGGFDMWVVKINSNGTLLWQKCLGTTGNDYGLSIDNTKDGGLIVGGSKNGNAWLVKLGGTLGTNESSKNKVTIYPNPVKDLLNISSENKIESVNVFNLAGQKSLSNPQLINGQLNVSQLTSGTYLLDITYQNGETETVKIIKK
ncbi:T9SS type A sorting domain-containing protein [Chryseobacterium sp. POL2]|uniref:T9SS type A sorting domain-containing protein n=1 Tax=Chryseobacterium sp. POL2 TaxID=2713414 RepID=UPI0013E1D508|nr:T9SS type A sorting domain-containing protein [Chryseobacterium sp. POL2]QIG88738.1 T9SS type A sorting domain-containing protein [Chryseobacterium sp. POL2]